jgi:nucleoside-diphosphate-sugar epimerase
MKIKGKKIFITGGAGFIGSSIAERMIADNHIVIYDTLHRNALAHTPIGKHKNLELIKGDVMDAAKLKKAAKGCNIAIHMASIAGVDTVLSMPVKTMEIALIGTYNMLNAVKDEPKIERFIDFSTSEVFGSYAFNVKETDKTTLGTVGEARWTYAVSKLATEHLTLNYHKQFGLPALAIRPFNIYGPRQVGIGAVHRFIVNALKGEEIIIHNDGSQIRSWCYIDDIVDGILLCLERKEAVGHTFNIGNPRSTLTIYNLAQEIKRLSSSKSKIIFKKREMQDVELRVPDIEKAKKILGYRPGVDLEEGLLRTIYWYRNNLHV